MNSKIGSLTGETDLHYSKDRIYPHWFCYAMRERAPYKELINKWFELFDSIRGRGHLGCDSACKMAISPSICQLLGSYEGFE